MSTINELKTPEEYFPYIGHRIDHKKQHKQPIYRSTIYTLLNKEYRKKIDEDTISLEGTPRGLFHKVIVKGLKRQGELTRDPQSVQLVTPRHRTLYDYTIGQPVHHELVNPEVMLLAGDNLFVSIYDSMLRSFGAIMFLRDDAVLKTAGHKKVFLTKERYVKEVYPAYLKQQMITGVPGENGVIRRDLIAYPEQEKHPITKKRGGGRTKTGRLRNLSQIIFDRLKGITQGTEAKLYITPVNISFSKVPEVPFIVSIPPRTKLGKNIQYMKEQYFIYTSYPMYAKNHQEARLDAVVHYGEPELFDDNMFSSLKDFIPYCHNLRDKIGLLETPFPLPFLYRALDTESELGTGELENRMKSLFDKYLAKGIDLSQISDGKGNMTPVAELMEKSIIHINANPFINLFGVKKNHFLTASGGRLFSHDNKLQEWYGNLLRHLD